MACTKYSYVLYVYTYIQIYDAEDEELSAMECCTVNLRRVHKLTIPPFLAVVVLRVA